MGLVAIAAVGGVLILRFTTGDEAAGDAELTLSALSRRGDDLTYHAVYVPDSPADGALGRLEVYIDPGVGARIDLDAALSTDFDDKTQDEVLKSGDILIANPELPATYISCRTERRTCRTADGRERLGLVSFLALFSFDTPFYDQPHNTERTSDLTAAGETGSCFVIRRRIGSSDEQATAVRSGFVPGVGLPKTLCYASDGLPLGGLISNGEPNTNWLRATEVERDIDPRVFDPPFPIVPSAYDE